MPYEERRTRRAPRARAARLPQAAVSCLAIALAWAACASAAQTDASAPAELVVTSTVLRPAAKVPPLGANGWGGCGAVEWAANNFVRNAGNEPVYWRGLHRVTECGENWFEIDGPGTTWYDLWASGFLSGASVRIYRLVDKANSPLPAKGDYIDVDKADRAEFVGKATIVAEGSEGFPDGGWIGNTYSTPHPNGWIRHGNLRVTDVSGVENARAYWYAVVAVDAEGQESGISNEVRVAAKAGGDSPPRILVSGDGDKVPALLPGRKIDFTPKVFGGAAPLRWELVGTAAAPATLLEGLKLDPATGRIAGASMADVQQLRVRLRVTDSKGRSDTRWYTFSADVPARSRKKRPKPGGKKPPKPAPPSGLTAVAGNGWVTLSWKASASPGVVAYRLKRSTAPAAKQMQRVYLAGGSPKLHKWDYVVLSRRFGNFDMKYVNQRVRGIGNPMNAPAWYWNGDLSKLSFSFAPHPKPLPGEMRDPGETCLQVKAAPGAQSISQTVFIGTGRGNESIWYGLFEPGKRYRLEAWLRQEGLGDGGRVSFSYGRYYKGIRKDFNVTGQWRKYTHEFTGPGRPRDTWHFGHTFTFTGPGTLWMDNARIFRLDRPADADKPYVPNPTVLDELLASQPATGPKAAHRIWFLTRDATMSSILSWHANSRVSPDWRTSVGGTMEMTLPMALTFDLRTGDSPQTRMPPWLVLQHVLHDERDWLNFVEYLAAPYDPKTDTPQSKPWAHRRWQQRGVATPWTDEFTEILVEFGNETWHNGHFADWLGFGRYNAIWQGGPEYGFFARYLIENMRKSPYWKSQRLDRKIRFCLGAGYNGSVGADGKVSGYGEEAMQSCPQARALGHANYVGPKWETGSKSTGIFSDHGVQATLLGFLAGPEANQIKMGQARDALAKSHHDYDIVAYEGGPSGYALPGRDSPAQKLANEKYGKSLAMGVASLDAWMRSYRYGWTYQNFLGYGQGLYWNSHTPIWDGFRPCPGWQALTLRNRHARGDLMAVEERNVPTIRWSKKAYPLVGGYAMRDGGRWSVFVVSRKLSGRHDGAGFGDGQAPVTLRLPFKAAGKITLHKLAGDPRESNREKLSIRPESREVPAASLRDGAMAIDERTGGGAGGMPGGSIFLYVFEAAR